MADSVKIKIEGDASSYKRTLQGLGKITTTAIKGMTAVTAGITGIWAAAGTASVRYNAQVEQLQTSFEVMTGSAAKAVEITERLRDLGARTPFEFTGLADSVVQLMQYNLSADEAIQTTEMIGDISQGSADKMSRIAMAYGQMSSAGKVQLEDVKQMLESGFNPLLEISERTGESMQSLYDRISKGTLSVDEITGAMISATSEGGKFYQSMEKQSQTLNGQVSTLKDNLQSLGGSVFEDVSETLASEILPGANDLIGRMQQAFDSSGVDGIVDELSRTIPDLVKAGETALAKVMTNVSGKLPNYARNLFASIPSLIRSVSGLAPQLANAFFEVGSEAVSVLVNQMPEWAPALLKGVGKLGKNVALGLLDIVASALHGVTDLITTDAEEVWESLYNQQHVAELSATVTGDIDVKPAKTSIETAYEELNSALHSDLLSEPQVEEITDLIGTDYDTIYAKLKSFGLSDTDAGTIASKVTSASNAVIGEIDKLNIGVDSATVARWIAQAEGSSIRLESAMKRAGLSPQQQDAVSGVFVQMNDNINGKLPDVIGDIYATLTDGVKENDDRESLVELLEQAYGEDIAAVDKWADEKIGELDETSATYEEDVKAIRAEAALYRGEITTLHTQMVGLVESMVGQPTAVVEKNMEKFAAIEARLAEINAYISETSASADDAFAQAYKRVRAGATTNENDIMNALDYAYSHYKVDQQGIEDAARAAKAEADAAWENGMKTEEDRTAHLETLAQIEQNKADQLADLENAYSEQVSELMAGVREAFSVVEPEMMGQVSSLGEKINVIDQLNQALETMQTGDDTAVAAVKEQVAQIISDVTGEEVFPSEMSFGRIESFVTELEDTVKEDLEAFEVSADDGTNPIATVFQAMFDSAAFEDFDIDTTTIGGKVSAMMNGVGTDAAAGIGAGAIAYDFSGDTDTIAGNFESDARGSFQSNSPAKRMKPLGGDVAAGIGEGAAEFDFTGHASTMAANAEKAIYGALSTGGMSAGKAFTTGISNGIMSGKSGVIRAAINVAQAAVTAIKTELDIHSPSRVGIALGANFGGAFGTGLQQSMQQAVHIAKVMTGELVTAASIPSTMRMSMPNIGQEIAVANAQAPTTPVYLDGAKIAEIQGYNNSTQLAWQNTRAAKGVGSR